MVCEGVHVVVGGYDRGGGGYDLSLTLPCQRVVIAICKQNNIMDWAKRIGQKTLASISK